MTYTPWRRDEYRDRLTKKGERTLMNETKPKTVFEEREELRCQIAETKGMLFAEQSRTRKLEAQLTATEEALQEAQRKHETATYRAMVFGDIAWEARYEAMRKVADAAAADAIVNAALRRLGYSPLIDQDARLIVCEASMGTADALQCAVREYRALAEPPALSPAKQAAVDRGLEGLEDEEALAKMEVEIVVTEAQ